MGKTIYSIEDPPKEQRKYRRFPLECSVDLRVPSADTASELKTVTKNVSIGGLLLNSPSSIPENSPVSFVITVQGSHLTHPVRLLGTGIVARVKPCDTGYEIGVKCDTPMEELGTTWVT